MKALLPQYFFSNKALGLFLLFLITMPSKAQITPLNSVIAHRGAWKNTSLPQNSIAALTEAISQKYGGSEFDVHRTLDGVLVVNHDDDFHGMIIALSTYQELQQFHLENGEPLPTLRDFLMKGMLQNQHTKLFCEIKPCDTTEQLNLKIARQVSNLVHELKAEKYMVFISFDYAMLQELKSLNPTYLTLYLDTNIPLQQIKKDQLNGLDFYFEDYRLHPEWISYAKSEKLLLNAWTVNEQKDIQWLLEQGFQGITTNEPELALQLAKAQPHN